MDDGRPHAARLRQRTPCQCSIFPPSRLRPLRRASPPHRLAGSPETAALRPLVVRAVSRAVLLVRLRDVDIFTVGLFHLAAGHPLDTSRGPLARSVLAVAEWIVVC